MQFFSNGFLEISLNFSKDLAGDSWKEMKKSCAKKITLLSLLICFKYLWKEVVYSLLKFPIGSQPSGEYYIL